MEQRIADLMEQMRLQGEQQAAQGAMLTRLLGAMAVREEKATEASEAKQETISSMRRRTLDEKSYKRHGNFAGIEKEWKDWAGKFKMTTKIHNREISMAMEMVEKMKEDATAADLGLTDEFINNTNVDMRKMAEELYEVLYQMMDGQALDSVKGVANGDGLAAWQKLHRAYNPKTIARIMSKTMAVVAPAKVSDMKGLVSQVERWEL
jgi:hypothetical protein